jgi:hypothetical protein
MKPLILIFLVASAALAESPLDKTFTVPDFKVTEASLRRSLPQYQNIFLYPPELRTAPPVYQFASPVCQKIKSYRVDTTAVPKLISVTDCTMSNRNTFLKAER